MTKEREALNAAIHWLESDIQADIFDDEHFEKSKSSQGGYCITCSFRQG